MFCSLNCLSIFFFSNKLSCMRISYAIAYFQSWTFNWPFLLKAAFFLTSMPLKFLWVTYKIHGLRSCMSHYCFEQTFKVSLYFTCSVHLIISRDYFTHLFLQIAYSKGYTDIPQSDIAFGSLSKNLESDFNLLLIQWITTMW